MPMMPGSFAYHRPASVKEAVALLAELGEEGRALAGGHSLIPMMKLRLASPAHLVDLGGVADLKGIRSDGGDIVIGAMTTQHEVVGSELLGAKLPILRETALVIADPQVRYVGTLVGNVANGGRPGARRAGREEARGRRRGHPLARQRHPRAGTLPHQDGGRDARPRLGACPRTRQRTRPRLTFRSHRRRPCRSPRFPSP